MDHIEPEELAVLALDGGEPDVAILAHLEACAACAAEYATLARTVELGREGLGDELESPPSAVWERIHGELGLAPELAGDPLAPADPPAPAESAEAPGTAADARTAVGTERHVAPSRPRTPGIATGGGRARRRRWWPIAAAAAVVGLLAGIGIGVSIGGAGGDSDAATVLANAELDAFPGWDAVGSATVEEDPSGERTLLVDLDADVPAGEVREVWLIRSDASGLVSLGLMDGDSVRLSVPAGIDLDEYSLVDVSAEPVDGDPAHSGDSIVRGELRAA
ncbi:anti-sigma factor [Agromyces sp. M3QZ16-3]|uniref:anti-sigma factor n=1 Tax=Agromyces sp. M3QZ16-3 TaxID=3447585 RepID=UPI003F68E573